MGHLNATRNSTNRVWSNRTLQISAILSITRRHPLAHTPEPDSSKIFPDSRYQQRNMMRSWWKWCRSWGHGHRVRSTRLFGKSENRQVFWVHFEKFHALSARNSIALHDPAGRGHQWWHPAQWFRKGNQKKRRSKIFQTIIAGKICLWWLFMQFAPTTLSRSWCEVCMLMRMPWMPLAAIRFCGRC